MEQRERKEMRFCGVMKFVFYSMLVVGENADILQIEYLVVNYKEDDEKVTLSLRQADILTALASDEKLKTEGGCVPALQDIISAGSKYAFNKRT